jgi:hypothetical protein
MRKGGGNGEPFAIICRYDAKAGRMFRDDRGQDASGNYGVTKTDITTNPKFTAIVDFENIEYGYMLFTPGQAPSMVLVPHGHQLPPQPSDQHKSGVRFMLKLSNDCAQGKPSIREITGTADAFRNGFGLVYLDYKAEKDKHPGLLPVITLEATLPVTTGQGIRSSTNYQPVFRIIGWQPRGDLVFIPRAQATQAAPQQHAAPQQSQFAQAYPQGQQAAPQTGAQRAAPPQNGNTPPWDAQPQQQAPQQQRTVSASDFG